jgi:hypothetical protein
VGGQFRKTKNLYLTNKHSDMAKFLEGNELNSEIGKIFKNADYKLILISPYIKLHHRYADELKAKAYNAKR